MERAVLIGLDYGPDGDISGYQCEGSKGQTVHWLAAWTEMKPGEELQAPPSGRKFTRIHIEGVDFGSVPQKWVPDQGKVGSCSGQGSANAHELNGSLWDVIAEKWQIRPLDLVHLVPPSKWAQWPTWSTLHDLVLRNHRFVIDPEAEAKVSDTGEIAIKVLGLWVNAEWLHVDHSFRAKAAQLLAKDYHWEPTTFGEAMLANRPPADRPPAEPAKEAQPATGNAYRQVSSADIGKQCEFSDGSTNPDGSLVWGIFSELQGIMYPRHGLAVKYYTEEGSYYDCRVKVEG